MTASVNYYNGNFQQFWENTRFIGAVNMLRPRQNGPHFTDDILQKYFFIEFRYMNISSKFVSSGQINNSPGLVQMMAWGRAGDETLSEPIVTDKFTDADMRHSVSMS